MRTRVASALVLLPAVVAAVFFGNPLWAAAVAVVAAVAVHEQYAMAISAGFRPDRRLGLVTAASLALAGLWPHAQVIPAIIAVAVMAAYVAQILRPPEARSMGDWMATLAFPVAMGTLMAYGVMLRGHADGLAWTTLVLVMVWANDSAAYLGGRAFGRRPFFASVSPKKTLEGALSGAVAAVAAGLIVPAVAVLGPEAMAPLAEVSPFALAALGLAISVVGPAGDLSQSFLKRQAGTKDSSHLIPGHGGVLDRIDSLVFAAPVGYFAALLLGG